MAQVIVIGAGLGGLPTAYELRHWLKGGHQITLVSDRPQFTFIPGLIQVALGKIPLEHVQLDVASLCKRHGLGWVDSAVVRVDPDQQTVQLANDQVLSYDYLVIASGPSLAFDEIPGLGPHGGYTQSVCNPAHALIAREAWEAFLENPTDLVVGAAPKTGCLGPGYEFALLADEELRKRGLRDRVTITYITPEPYAGYLGLPDLYMARELTEGVLEEQGVQVVTDAAIARVLPDRVELSDGRQFPFGYAMILPAFRGAEYVQASGLGNDRGFISILPTQRHQDHERIYALGVSVHLEQPYHTPVPIGLPKSGQMTEAMGAAVAYNIAVDLGALPSPHQIPTLEALCFAEFGQTGIAYIAAPILPDPANGQRRYSYATRGAWVNWAKAAFERYFLLKMQWGIGLPWFELWGLKLLFGLSLLRPVTQSVRPNLGPNLHAPHHT